MTATMEKWLLINEDTVEENNMRTQEGGKEARVTQKVGETERMLYLGECLKTNCVVV